jgi:RNA polymerase sigma-70 factor (ECF subfamily)
VGVRDGATVHAGSHVGLHVTSLEARPSVDLLVDRARAGDLDAFEALAERSLPDVYRLASAIVGPDDARDVAQEALVAAWGELPRLRETSRFEPWLRSIVLNRARNVLRSRRRRPTVGLIEGYGFDVAHEPLAETEQRLEIEAAFGGLGSAQREVLALHYVLDLPLREVARILEIPEGTAKSRLHAALRALRERFPER